MDSGVLILQKIIDDSGVGAARFWRAVRSVRAKRGYRLETDTINGKLRALYKPGRDLSRIQCAILQLLRNIPVSEYAHSYTGRSHVEHARLHVGQEVVVSIDVKNCFPAIKISHVSGVFKSLGFSSKDVSVLTSLTTADGHLAQGFHTSPYLQNLVFRDIDDRVSVVASQCGAIFGRFADDLILSGTRVIIDHIGSVKAILQFYGFEVNEAKWRKSGIRYGYQAQYVCGVLVNKRLNPSREYLKSCAASVDRLRSSKQMGEDVEKQNHVLTGKIAYAKHLNPRAGNWLARLRHQAINPSHRGKRYRLKVQAFGASSVIDLSV